MAVQSIYTLLPSEIKLVHPCLDLSTIRSGRFFIHPFSLNAITLEISPTLVDPPVIIKESSSLMGMMHPSLNLGMKTYNSY